MQAPPQTTITLADQNQNQNYPQPYPYHQTDQQYDAGFQGNQYYQPPQQQPIQYPQQNPPQNNLFGLAAMGIQNQNQQQPPQNYYG